YKIEADETHSGSIGSTEAKVTIGRKEITIPIAKTGLTYTGTELTGVEAGTGYTLEGNTSTNAGDYTATATPDKNHQWEGSETPTDSVIVDWTIAKADSTITIPTESMDKTYDGKAAGEPAVEKTGSDGSVSFKWYIKNS
ncbi:hypothetical protein LI177_14545, partial [bacterium 210820-DFI.6.37]|nr:hypothetical protein [bacterium 210820-DFI.6.37]